MVELGTLWWHHNRRVGGGRSRDGSEGRRGGWWWGKERGRLVGLNGRGAGVRAVQAGGVVGGQDQWAVGLHAILGQSVDTVFIRRKVVRAVVSGGSMSLALVRWVWLLSWIIGRMRCALMRGEGVRVVLVSRERQFIGREGVVVEVAWRCVMRGSAVGREDVFLWAIVTRVAGRVTGWALLGRSGLLEASRGVGARG